MPWPRETWTSREAASLPWKLSWLTCETGWPAPAVIAAAQRCGVAGPVSTVADGMVGAAVLALRHGDAAVDEIVFARIQSSLAALR